MGWPRVASSDNPQVPSRCGPQGEGVRTPRARCAPIDSSRMAEWLNRFDGYRIAATEARINCWLENFKLEDADLAALMRRWRDEKPYDPRAGLSA